MKIFKTVSVEQEVGIEICGDDLAAALAEEFHNATLDSLGLEPAPIKHALNSCAKFFNAITDEQIKLMGAASRKVVCAYLLEASRRFEEVAT